LSYVENVDPRFAAWMSLYFSGGVWARIPLIHADPRGTRTAGRRESQSV